MKKMKRKGFTLVELLVVISIIALLMAILMPALAQVRRLAQRIMCGANLAAIAKAMLVYSNDNDEDMPRAGGPGSVWSGNGYIKKWNPAVTSTTPQADAFGTDPTRNPATITSCFYLLVKYTDAAPKVFVCKGDTGARTFDLSEATTPITLTDLTLAWDFGGRDTLTVSYPGTYVSYSYHLPFNHSNTYGAGCFAMTSSANSASPLCADRNPYLDKNAAYIDNTSGDTAVQTPSWDTTNNLFIDRDHVRNCAAHSREGQNVVYVDAHVSFEKMPNCGVNNDLIWMCWQKSAATVTQKDREFTAADLTGILNCGMTDRSSVGPVSYEDAFLVNECMKDF
jgi:prepilin-type N-terminal cleavage/methylation domain-containing protein